MMTLLPVLLLRGRQNVLDHHLARSWKQATSEDEHRARIEQLWLGRPRWSPIVAIVALSVLRAMPARKVYFDYNLLQHAERRPAGVVLREEADQFGQQVRALRRRGGDSLEQAVALNAGLTNLPTVASVDVA